MAKPLRPTLIDGNSYGIVDRVTGNLLSVGTVISDELPDTVDVIELDTPPTDHVWNPTSRKYTPAIIPQEELDKQVQRESDAERIAVLRTKVGPGKPGLTQADRDELNLIMLDNAFNSF